MSRRTPTGRAGTWRAWRRTQTWTRRRRGAACAHQSTNRRARGRRAATGGTRRGLCRAVIAELDHRAVRHKVLDVRRAEVHREGARLQRVEDLFGDVVDVDRVLEGEVGDSPQQGACCTSSAPSRLPAHGPRPIVHALARAVDAADEFGVQLRDRLLARRARRAVARDEDGVALRARACARGGPVEDLRRDAPLGDRRSSEVGDGHRRRVERRRHRRADVAMQRAQRGRSPPTPSTAPPSALPGSSTKSLWDLRRALLADDDVDVAAVRRGRRRVLARHVALAAVEVARAHQCAHRVRQPLRPLEVTLWLYAGGAAARCGLARRGRRRRGAKRGGRRRGDFGSLVRGCAAGASGIATGGSITTACGASVASARGSDASESAVQPAPEPSNIVSILAAAIASRQ